MKAQLMPSTPAPATFFRRNDQPRALRGFRLDVSVIPHPHPRQSPGCKIEYESVSVVARGGEDGAVRGIFRNFGKNFQTTNLGGCTGLIAGKPALIKQNATHCFLSTQAATSWYPSFRALRSKARTCRS
ncbi:MAG: hypothetical protein LBF06_20680, partial [Pseudomonas sp.]|nr:hypothetical protein [Pseudomonas sp.]